MPSWLNQAVFYEVYPQSFSDSDGDGIGDIPGMMQRLPYIAECGFNAIWLNPWFSSSFRDAGYDITDYYRVAPRYGTNDDAGNFLNECHRLGIKVVLDLVIGHVSIDHPWFEESCKLEHNRCSDLFIWSPVVSWRGAPDEEDDYYISGWSSRGAFKANFFAVQPAFNFGFNKTRFDWEMPYDSEIPMKNREVVRKIMRFWLDMGCDGFRVDMAHSMIKRDPGYEKTMEFWQDIREMFDREYPEAVLISEWFHPQYSLAGGFHMDFTNCANLFRNESWMACRRRNEPVIMSPKYSGGLAKWLGDYREMLDKVDGRGLTGFYSGNHDRWRMSYYASPESMIVNMAMIFTMPGCPFLYYGDELGMRYIPGVQTEGSGSRGGSRTPMQWDRSPNLGFSSAEPGRLYLPVDPAPDAPVVSEALAGRNPIFNAVKELILLHKSHPAFAADGKFDLLHGETDTFPLVYMRSPKDGDGKLIAALNPTEQSVECPLPAGNYKPVWSYRFAKGELGGEHISMPPVSVMIASVS